MRTEFTKNGIRYSLCVAPLGRNEPLVAPCKTANQVWANEAQKRKYTNGLDREAADLPGSDVRAVGGVKQRRKPRTPWSTPKPVPAEHFLESAPLD